MGKVPVGLAKFQAAKKAAASGTGGKMEGMASKPMMGGKMPPKGMPMVETRGTANAMAKMPAQAKAYGMKGMKPPTAKGGKK